MAENKILSHCELLQTSGDVISCDAGRFEATGTSAFESAVEDLEPERQEEQAPHAPSSLTHPKSDFFIRFDPGKNH